MQGVILSTAEPSQANAAAPPRVAGRSYGLWAAAAIAALTVASFSRDGKIDDTALDEALATAKRLTRKMRIGQFWIMKRLAARRTLTPMESRVWSR